MDGTMQCGLLKSCSRDVVFSSNGANSNVVDERRDTTTIRC